MKTLIYHIGAFKYTVRLVRNLADEKSRALSARSFADPPEIHLSDQVSPPARFEVLLTELKHCWLFHVPAPTTPQEETDLAAMIAASFYADLERQGGRRALDELELDVAEADLPPAPTAAIAPQMSDDELTRLVRFPSLDQNQWGYVKTECRRRGIDPRDIHVIVRKSRETGLNDVVIITTIRIVRAIADRTGKRLGETAPEFCDAEGNWKPGPWVKPEPPHAARVYVTRRDSTEKHEGVAYYKMCAGYYRGPDGVIRLTECWEKGAAHMLGKCASVAAHRVAWPHELGGLYTTDEIDPRRPAADQPTADPQEPSSPAGAVAEASPFIPDDPRLAMQFVDETTPDVQGLPLALLYTGMGPLDRAKAFIQECSQRWPRILRASEQAFAAAVLRAAAQAPPAQAA